MLLTVLSPHLDDAAFSCGLLLSALLKQGVSVRIVDLCTVSMYAPYLDFGDAGDRCARVSAARWKEEESFAALLCRSAEASPDAVQLVDLGWKDAPLRWSVPDERVLAPVELPVLEIEDLVRTLKTFPYTDLVLAPAAVGGHVDHRLMRQAATKAFSAGRLLFYEDLPYACNGDLPAPPLGQACLQPASGTAALKYDFAMCYPSQIAPDLARSMEYHAASLDGSERFYGTAEAIAHLESALISEHPSVGSIA